MWFSDYKSMENEATETILTFLNILTAELQLEEISSIIETQILLPILARLIKFGELEFVPDYDYKFADMVELIKSNLGQKSIENLRPEDADNGNVHEIGHIILAILFVLHLKQEQKFHEICDKMDEANNSLIANMIDSLKAVDSHTPLPFSSIWSNASATESYNKKNSTSRGIQIFSSHNNNDNSDRQIALDEDLTKYKMKCVELEAKVKQMETMNSSLNEQFAIQQNYYSEMENKFEAMKQTQTLNQETIDNLETQLKESADEMEQIRYQNSQLQRESSIANDRCTRVNQKMTTDLKEKEEENKMLYARLEEYVKQLTEKESLETKVPFLEQQLKNQQGTIKELREDLEKEINRANKAEVELKKQQSNNRQNNFVMTSGNEGKRTRDDTEECAAVSLHEELISTDTKYFSENNHNGFNGSRENISRNYSDVTDEGFAQLKTRLEILQRENNELRKTHEEDGRKLEEMQKSETKNILEKANEIERLIQSCESQRTELQKIRRNEETMQDKCKNIEEENIRLEQTVGRFEEALDKSAQVIREYSIASEEQCSAADLLQMKHELERVQTENQRLLVKMDQFKHDATQEQRLITQHWYDSQRRLFQMQHGLGVGTSSSPGSSMRSSLLENMHSATPSHNQQAELQSPTPAIDEAGIQSSRAHSQQQQSKSLYHRMNAASSSSHRLSTWIIILPLLLMCLSLILWFLECDLSLDITYA